MTTTEKAICQASNANTSPCTKDATKTIHWPGRSLVMCDEHAKAAKKVADAMGFDLSIVPLALAFALALLGCGPDTFYAIAQLEDATDSGHASPESSADAELDAGADVSADGPGVDVEAGADAAGVDSGEACPMVGASCAPVGLRKCRGPQTVWYCAGTWTSNACTQGNPACSPCDAGFCCTIGPICP
jgi:hypothetical protein